MPPNRGSQGYDFTPILSHYILLFTFILALAGWFTAFFGQIVATSRFGRASVGVGWFTIFLQLFVIAGVLHTLASDAIAMHRFQLSVFTAAAMVLAVIEVDLTIYGHDSAQQATGAGWLLLAMADIIWVLFFTSEEDSLQLHLFNSMGTGGLTPPGRHRRRATVNRDIGGGANGYGGGYGGGIGSNTMAGASVGGGKPISQGGISNRDFNGGGPTPTSGAFDGGMGGVGANAPLMSGGASGAGDISGASQHTEGAGDNYQHKAKALYAYTASPDDPSEISFSKGEILEILNTDGKWWHAKNAEGQRGIAPSNYLQII